MTFCADVFAFKGKAACGMRCMHLPTDKTDAKSIVEMEQLLREKHFHNSEQAAGKSKKGHSTEVVAPKLIVAPSNQSNSGATAAAIICSILFITSCLWCYQRTKTKRWNRLHTEAIPPPYSLDQQSLNGLDNQADRACETFELSKEEEEQERRLKEAVAETARQLQEVDRLIKKSTMERSMVHVTAI
jgi:hypothetical protein